MSEAQRKRTLSVSDAIVIILGIVIGAGIFRTPSIVAASSGGNDLTLLAWVAGGAVSLLGALCYAELSSAYPHAGGEYHFLSRAFGSSPGFLFGWARLTVIQTGSIAMLAFLIGDYATEIHSLGLYSSAGYGALSILLLTAINIFGLRPGKVFQWTLVSALVLGLVLVISTGFLLPGPNSPAPPAQASGSGMGKAMVFVLLTYGGWNEAAYLSGEVRQGRRSMVKVLVGSIVLITLLYLVFNVALLKALGYPRMAESQAVAADLMRLALGERGAHFISFLIGLAALSTMNATIITGARLNFALGRDYRVLGFLGRWNCKGSSPVNALLLQGAAALLLVGVGAGSRHGFETMVAYTSPVFWFFFLLVGLSLFRLRRVDSEVTRHFSVPLYPWTPLLFCGASAGMLYSSLQFTGRGAFLGIAVLISGIPLLLVARWRERRTVPTSKGEIR